MFIILSMRRQRPTEAERGKMKIMSVQNVLCGGFLLAGSIFDLFERKIPLWLPALCGILASGICLAGGASSGCPGRALLVQKILLPLLPGTVMIMLALLPGRGVGIGDGISTAAAALCTGFMFILLTLTLAFVLAAGCSLALLIRHRVNARSKIPFLPFLFTAYVICLLCSGV